MKAQILIDNNKFHSKPFVVLLLTIFYSQSTIRKVTTSRWIKNYIEDIPNLDKERNWLIWENTRSIREYSATKKGIRVPHQNWPLQNPNYNPHQSLFWAHQRDKSNSCPYLHSPSLYYPLFLSLIIPITFCFSQLPRSIL